MIELCKRCIWPRQCKHYDRCGRITMLTNQLDAAMSRHDLPEIAQLDLKLKRLEERGCTAAEM